MIFGTVRKWLPERGFGFIQPDDASADIFVHAQAFSAAGLPEPRVGDRLSFEIEQDTRDPTRRRAAKLKSASAVMAPAFPEDGVNDDRSIEAG